ncbi:MAG: translation initiation factor IF-1 [Candidatus Pacebacteria bacterium]|jgi:translation initiation factor IF-1|nr:translation initiation factor IF-1 [Candidatus Paceibacterota bacterium]MBT3511513.1 translation initiation factor IF-1 [Candidatus Paceibacterota bacterium]MBT4005017.1 translation initiation factor IF-1 [Candidatus Paceibacterota bacterium]MBT4358793.1 translation initiation factor IF-1 [Candidatus Paceibacterota bacterium]MBT4680601.1 translation initiation factor IF-1 [Candidatus Paceibacterota bacterium]
MGKVQDHKRAAKARRQIDRTSERESNPDRMEIEGVVEQCLPNTMFKVRVTAAPATALVDKVLLGTLAGKMRLYRIRVMPGDEVKGYVSKYDLGKCKITYRSIKRPTQQN